MKSVLILILFCSFFTSANDKLNVAVKAQLQGENTPYDVGFIDLNNDNIKDAVVYLKSRNWCGSGGCTTFVFKGTDSGFVFQSKIMIVKKPIIISQSKTNGYLDLIVNTGGVGTVVLKFNGKNYPLNPSTQPKINKPHSINDQVLLN